jgi:hypothetical protein
MNWITIALTAALLALQAALLSLLQGGQAHAETVYRCGQGVYQATACTSGQAQTLTFEDDRTAAQLAQGLTQRHAALRGQRSMRSHRTKKAGSATQQASALSSHRAGMAPFHNGQWLSDAKQGTSKPRRPKRERERARYFTAKAQEASLAP